MRLWTIQPVGVYEKLKSERVLHYDPTESELLVEVGEVFRPAYDWLVEQMRVRVAPPPVDVQYPFWAWHTIDWKHKKPDLRLGTFRGYSGAQTCIELEIPDKDVLLSDEGMWHLVLNDGYYGKAQSDEEYEAEARWFDGLPPQEQLAVNHKSWEKIFEIDPPINTKWDIRGDFIQATFWELRLDQVVSVRYFTGRRKR